MIFVACNDVAERFSPSQSMPPGAIYPPCLSLAMLLVWWGLSVDQSSLWKQKSFCCEEGGRILAESLVLVLFPVQYCRIYFLLFLPLPDRESNAWNFFPVFYDSVTAGVESFQWEHHHFVILLIERLLPEDTSEVHYSPLSVLNNCP